MSEYHVIQPANYGAATERDLSPKVTSFSFKRV